MSLIKKLNPEIIIEKFNDFKVIRDDYLIGGTKQRAIDAFIDDFHTEYIYAGPAEGYAQVALAYIGYLYNVKVTIFLADRKYETDLTNEARNYGAKIYYILPPNRIQNLREEAEIYESKRKSRLLLPFGLDDEYFVSLLTERIREAWGKKHKPKRLWMTVGSGTLLKSLTNLFPETEFLLVQVGKKIWPDQVVGFKNKVYISDKRFRERASILPPYNSVITYDAKVWEFVLKYGKKGDYIWNVGGEIYY